MKKDEIKIRVLEAKKFLPSSGITSLFFHHFTDVKKNYKNKVKLTNVLQLRTVDLDFTEKIESLVELIKPKKKANNN